MKNKFFTLAAIATISILTISLVSEMSSSKFYAAGEESYIPIWIKNVAKWWANGEISDSDFLQGIQYLLIKGVMKIPQTKVDSNNHDIPSWIKIVAGLWSQDKVRDSDFVQAVQYLVQNGVIKIPIIQTQNQIVETYVSPTVWFAPLPEKVGKQYVHNKDIKSLVGQQSIGSKDFMKLFVEGAPWKNAEQHVQVFKLYQNWVINATDSELKQTVTYLNNHNIAIALESGPLTVTSICGQGVEGFSEKQKTFDAINRIQEDGGTVHFIALDEPFFFGSIYNGKNACHWSILQVAEEVTAYIHSINIFYPDTVVGDIEPITNGAGLIQYENWLNIYSAVSGSKFPFFDIDTTWSQPNWPVVDKEMETFLHNRGIQVGIIYWGNTHDSSDEKWLTHAEERMVAYEAEAGGRPDRVIFQSWNDYPHYVLPETSPDTFTHLILSYFKTRTILNIMSSQLSSDLQVNGTLMQIDRNPIADAPIQLFTGSVSESGIFVESSAVPVDSAKTDKNGVFHFNYSRIKSNTILQAEYAGDEDHWPAYFEIQIN